MPAVKISLEPMPIDQASPAGGVVRAARRPEGWPVTGPAPVIPAEHSTLLPGPDEDLCWLAGNWRILQRTDGHRTSLDDLVTAHLATMLMNRPPARCLDLGCGIGSVLLFVAWRFPETRLVGVEAQAVSAGLARRSIAWNGIGDRAVVVTDDFRTAAVLKTEPRFDLVTGTPPYFPIGAGPESDHVQRAPCRFEHRGGVEAYCLAAAPMLAAGAPFVACQAWNQRERVEPAAAAAGLRLVRWREIVPREGKEPLLCIFAMRATEHAESLQTLPPLVVRDRAGRRTAEFKAIRAAMGMPA
jgi:tRNA1Val (adenine37-N6)-methyltransferase